MSWRLVSLWSGLVVAIGCGGEGPTTGADGSSGPSDSGPTVASATAGSDVTGVDTTGVDATGSSGDETSSPPPTGAWEDRAPLAAGPRQETGVAALDGEVYVVGGFTAVGGLVARVEAYDPEADTWRAVAELPQPMHHVNLAAVAGELWVAGFLEGLTFEARGEVWAYDPSADAWSARTAMPMGTERGSAGVAVYQDRMYLFGGFRQVALDDVWVYDAATDLWDVAADLPDSLDHLVAATIGDRIYVVGGRDADIGAHTDALHVYDPATDSWSPGPPMPTSRGGMAAAVLDGRLFVAGGEGNTEAESGVFEMFEAYDPITEVWTTLPPMPTPRHGMGAATVDGLVFVPGGATVEALGASATHEAWRASMGGG